MGKRFETKEPARPQTRIRRRQGPAVEQRRSDALGVDAEPGAAVNAVAAAIDGRGRRDQLGFEGFAVEELVAVGGDDEGVLTEALQVDRERTHEGALRQAREPQQAARLNGEIVSIFPLC